MSRAIVLVGHGGVPKNCPHELVRKLKQLEAQRRAAGKPMSQEERELDQKIRHWPRTPQNDPYKEGLEALADQLRPLLKRDRLAIAYNEFCSPTLEEAVEELIKDGIWDITVVSSMFTPGGSHAEIEIPETVDKLKRAHPEATIRYAWPFDKTLVASMIATHLKQFKRRHPDKL
jgi:sirohydrochlorin cobaltochelatase